MGFLSPCGFLLSILVLPACPLDEVLLQAQWGSDLFACGGPPCRPPDLCACGAGRGVRFRLQAAGGAAAPPRRGANVTLACADAEAAVCRGPAGHAAFTLRSDDDLGVRVGAPAWLEQPLPPAAVAWQRGPAARAAAVACPPGARLEVLRLNATLDAAAHPHRPCTDAAVVHHACATLPCQVGLALSGLCPALLSATLVYRCVARALFMLRPPLDVGPASWCARHGHRREADCAVAIARPLDLDDGALRPVLYAHGASVFPVYPIGFSVPEDLFVRTPGPKTQDFSAIIPGNKDTYRFSSLQSYIAEYRRSCFVVTTKKGGWDCLRHPELVAAGAVPFFVDLEYLPPKTLVFYPRPLLEEARNFPGVTLSGDHLNPQSYAVDHTVFNVTQYFDLAARWLEHGRRWLTSRAMAQYLLQTIAVPAIRTVLFMESCVWDYLAASLQLGLKQLLGSANVHDFSYFDPVYVDNYRKRRKVFLKCPPSSVGRNKQLYALPNASARKTWTNVLHDFRDVSHNPEDIQRAIAQRWYDVVVYGAAFRALPYLDLVARHYPPSRVAFIIANDAAESNLTFLARLASLGHVFEREVLEPAAGGPHTAKLACGPSLGKCKKHGLVVPPVSLRAAPPIRSPRDPPAP